MTTMIQVCHEKCFFSELEIGDRFVILPESFSTGSRSLPQYKKISTATCVRNNPEKRDRERHLSPEQPVLKLIIEE